MFPFYYDPTYIFVIIGIIIAGVAQMKVSGAYSKYSAIKSAKGKTGAEAAMEFLRLEGIRDVEVEEVGGKLSDHYDPTKKKVRLSKDIYYGTSIASLSVAAHEVGHAIQYSKGYFPVSVRGALFPIVNFSSKISWILISLGILMTFFSNNTLLLQIGIVLFTVIVIFQIVTLPVEFNASRRALVMLEQNHYLDAKEMGGAKKMLSAAALTYVAAAITGILQLLRLLVILNRNND